MREDLLGSKTDHKKSKQGGKKSDSKIPVHLRAIDRGEVVGVDDEDDEVVSVSEGEKISRSKINKTK